MLNSVSPKLRRGALALALFAGATTTITLLEVSSASAATNVPFTVPNTGESGTAFLEAFWGDCGGTVGYDSAFNWDTAGVLSTRPSDSGGTWTLPPTEVPTNGPGCGSTPLSRIRLETYPKLNAYDPWTGSIGGVNSQRSKVADGNGFANFGVVPFPTDGVTPPGFAYPAFRMTGNIIASTPVLDDQVITDLFQVPCGYPDVCIQPPQSSSGAYVGGFTTGKNHGNEWTGSVSWPGRYQVYVKYCPTGWNASNVCSVASTEVVGFVDISEGHEPTWDLDATCFGILNCQYLAGGPKTSTGGFHPLPQPTRILDTRFNNGITGAVRPGDGRLPNNFNPVHRIAETQNHDLKVTGLAGIPAYGVSAVLLNVTAVQPPGADFLSVYPRPASSDIFNNQGTYGANPPATTSNLNLVKGENVPNLVLAPVGAGGTIRIWNAGPGAMHVIADVAGWFDTGAPETSPDGLTFTGIAPDRLLDTRLTPPSFQPGDDRELLVAGFHDVPADAQSVVVNITSVSPAKVGYVTVYPNGTAPPLASNLNVNPGITRSNLAVVKVGTDGKIRLAVFESEMDLIVDVMGYFGGTGGGLTTAIKPVRVADSRNGTGTPVGRFAQCETRDIRVAGVAGIPSGITAVYINLTAADTDNGGYLTVWPAGETQPATSNLNWDPFRNTPNMVIVKVSSTGFISIANGCNPAGTNVSVIVDVFGYVGP